MAGLKFDDTDGYMEKIADVAGSGLDTFCVKEVGRNFIGEAGLFVRRAKIFGRSSLDACVLATEDPGNCEPMLVDLGDGLARLCVHLNSTEFVCVLAPEDPAEGLAWLRMAYRCGFR